MNCSHHYCCTACALYVHHVPGCCHSRCRHAAAEDRTRNNSPAVLPCNCCCVGAGSSAAAAADAAIAATASTASAVSLHGCCLIEGGCLSLAHLSGVPQYGSWQWSGLSDQHKNPAVAAAPASKAKRKSRTSTSTSTSTHTYKCMLLMLMINDLTALLIVHTSLPHAQAGQQQPVTLPAPVCSCW